MYSIQLPAEKDVYSKHVLVNLATSSSSSIFPACMYYQEYIILVVRFTSQYLQWVDLTNLVLIPSKHRLILLLLEHNVHPLHDHHIRYNVNPHTVLHCWLSLIHWGLHEPLTVLLYKG